MDLSFLTTLVDAGKLGGWVRALVGALLAAGIAKYPGLKDYLDPATQAEIGVAVSGIVVGIWSHYAKSLAAPVVVGAPAKPVDRQLTGRVVSWLPLFGAGLLFSLLLVHSAFAADVAQPVKARPLAAAVAPAPLVCSPTLGCTGFHADFAIDNAGTGLNAFNLAQINANGTALGIGGGYQWFDGHYWFGARAAVLYDVTNGIGGSENLMGQQMVELGGDLFGALGLSPPQQTGFLSTLTTAIPTADVGLCERGKAVGYCAGATLHYFLPNTPLELDVGYINANYGTTAIANGTNITVDNIVWFGGRYHF